MKAIFEALRALRRADKHLLLTPQAGSLSWALHYFDRCNRGHQHLLEHLSQQPLFGHYRADSAPGAQARFNKFRESMTTLMNALSTTPKAAIPQAPLFQALWTAKDDTGALQATALRRLGIIISYGTKLPEGLELDSRRIVFDGTHLIATLTLCSKAAKTLYAVREKAIPISGLDTLQNCADALRIARREISQLLDKASNWPEFSESRMQEALGRSCRGQLEQFLKGCTLEQRNWLATNWTTIRPTARHFGSY